MSSKVRIVLETTAAEATAEKAAATNDYVVESVAKLDRPATSPLQEARFVDPVAMTLVGTLAVISVRIVNHWLKSDEGGVQIDTRTKPPTISRLVNVPAGVIVEIQQDGTAKVHREKYDSPEDFLPKLKSFLGL